ncbi:MAG: sigma-70 family RNA polymerase sigma factor [Synergistota bacterium]|nr:sigma-70 family RNA polymerase sigma factor [Synergistota bacterium]
MHQEKKKTIKPIDESKIIGGDCPCDGTDDILDLEELVLRFLPLIKSLAKRYAGRGADFEELLGEAACHALELIIQCPDEQPLPLYLSNMLPGRVRDAAKKLRRQADHGSFEEMAETGYEPEDPNPLYNPKLLLAGIPIDPQEFLLVEGLLRGLRQKEIAKDLGCSQQNVSVMVRKLRKKLEDFLKDLL